MCKRGNYFIAVYDKEDNYIRDFESIEECANYFHTTKNSIYVYLCRQYLLDCKYRLFKMNDDQSTILNKSL